MNWYKVGIAAVIIGVVILFAAATICMPCMVGPLTLGDVGLLAMSAGILTYLVAYMLDKE